MISRLFRPVYLCLCLVAAFALGAFAQGRPPGGGPGGPPGGMGPGGPGGPGGASPSTTYSASATNASRHGGLQFGPVGRWWDDKTVVQAIGLRKDQQRAMDGIFNANKGAILSSYKALLSEQAKLDKLNKDPQVDKARLFEAIDAVSQARASLQKATSQMLLQIRQQMDAEQIAKLEELQ